MKTETWEAVKTASVIPHIGSRQADKETGRDRWTGKQTGRYC